MPRPQCPACRTPLSVMSIVSALSPYHLACGSCKQRLRVESWFEHASMAFAIAFGVVEGVRVVHNGILAEAPLALGVYAGFLLLVIAYIFRLAKVDRRE